MITGTAATAHGNRDTRNERKKRGGLRLGLEIGRTM